ncbi:MAG: TerB family tellurite resistance protein [Alphaproteobacteria bacterium]
MFERVSALFGGTGPTAREDQSAQELPLAAAALLVEAALIDGSFDEGERAYITRLVGEHFGLGEGESQALLAEAERVASDAAGLVRFTRVIKRRFSHEERVRLLEMIWEVVYADGVLHAYEDSLLRRIAALIYVSDKERGAARRRALKRVAAGAGGPAA